MQFSTNGICCLSRLILFLEFLDLCWLVAFHLMCIISQSFIATIYYDNELKKLTPICSGIQGCTCVVASFQEYLVNRGKVIFLLVEAIGEIWNRS